MQVSELVAATGVPLATVKYYLREGLLMPGRATSATRASYDDTHVRRLELIKALSGLGLSIKRLKVIVGLIDTPGPSLFDTLGEAIAALPPSPEPEDDGGTEVQSGQQERRSTAALKLLGWSGPADWPAVGQLEVALSAAARAGVAMDADRLAAYVEHVRAIAAVDIEFMPMESASSAIEYAVLGTALYEPIIAALRRLAHAEIALKLLEPDGLRD